MLQRCARTPFTSFIMLAPRSFGIHFHRTRILKKATVLGFYLEHHRTMCVHTFLMLSRNELFVDAMAHHASMFCMAHTFHLACFFLRRAQSKISTMPIDNLTIENDSRRCVHSHARTQRDSQFVFATFLFIVHCCISALSLYSTVSTRFASSVIYYYCIQGIMTTPRRLVAVSLKRKGKLATIVPLVVLLVFLLQVNAIRRLPNDLNGKPLNSTFFRNLKNTAVGVPIPTSPEDHLVTSLPYLKNDAFPTKHYAGLLPANSKKTKYFFYWLFEPDSSIDKEDDIPLLLWMNGGPGCSSMDGTQRSVPLDMHDSTICITHTHACMHALTILFYCFQ